MWYHNNRNRGITMDAQTIFYHIYPLGMLGCEKYHQHHVVHRLPQLHQMIPKLKELNVNAVYIGPIFKSMSHGYDTIDYKTIDERLGDHIDFQYLVEQFHHANIKVIVDAVFHHVGREFFAFQDVLKHREHSKYVNWFCNVNFKKDNVFHDGFCYDTWKGAASLVKLNLAHIDVQNYILDCILMWIREFKIDGLRLDAAECMIFPFLELLHLRLKKQYPNFYLVGEVVFGDYQQWIYPYRLDAVTNYELYHALHHCHNTSNYEALKHTLNRQFGPNGLYRTLNLYHFVDNHDVHRIASLLKTKEKLTHIYTLLFTLPGTPSIYYGSEYGMKGRKQRYNDDKLRPKLDLTKKRNNQFRRFMILLTKLRTNIEELQDGSFEVLYCSKEQFVFQRSKKETTYVLLNQSDQDVEIDVNVPFGTYIDAFTKEVYQITSSKLTLKAYSSLVLIHQNRKEML